MGTNSGADIFRPPEGGVRSSNARPRAPRKPVPPTTIRRQTKRRKSEHQVKIQLDEAVGRRDASKLFSVQLGVLTEIENRFFASLIQNNFFPTTDEAEAMLIAVLTAMGRREFRNLRTIFQKLTRIDFSRYRRQRIERASELTNQ